MIDTHCHLDLPIFDQDRSQVLTRSREAGVTTWLVPAILLQDFPRLLALKGPGIHHALGLHPCFMDRHPKLAWIVWPRRRALQASCAFWRDN